MEIAVLGGGNGSLAAAIQVSRTGNTPLQFKEFSLEINQLEE